MKKSNTRRRFLPLLAVLFIAGLLSFVGCDGGSTAGYEPDPTEEPDTSDTSEPFTDIELDSVAPDGQLETVTWNLLGYGVRGQGPGNELQQTENILQVIDSLRADLYAFQEVHNREDLNRLVNSMSGYRGFVAEFISQDQRTAFAYNTATIDSISSGAITDGQDDYAWASGRFPFYFEFEYSYQNTITPIYAVVIHAKAFAEENAYERRKQAAQDLYTYLTEHKPDANIIFLGDYNDDVDQSIYNDAETPYQLFVENDQHFQVVTKSLSEKGLSSTVSYDDMIDHITISNELYDDLIDQSEQVYQQVKNFITEYGSTTSDHYPVWTKFNLSGN